MLRRWVASRVREALQHYVEGDFALDLGGDDFDVELADLTLRPTILPPRSPIGLELGSVGRLAIEVPLIPRKAKPLQLFLDDLRLVLRTQEVGAFDEDEVHARLMRTKLTILESMAAAEAEAAAYSGSSSDGESEGEGEDDDTEQDSSSSSGSGGGSLLERMVSQVLYDMRIVITNVVVRLESSTDSCEVALNRFELYTDDAGDRQLVLDELRADVAELPVLPPVSALTTATLRPTAAASIDAGLPWLEAHTRVDPVRLSLSRPQFVAAARIWEELTRRDEWVDGVIAQYLQRCRAKVSVADVAEYRALCRQPFAALDAEQRARVTALEGRLPLRDILNLRRAAAEDAQPPEPPPPPTAATETLPRGETTWEQFVVSVECPELAAELPGVARAAVRGAELRFATRGSDFDAVLGERAQRLQATVYSVTALDLAAERPAFPRVLSCQPQLGVAPPDAAAPHPPVASVDIRASREGSWERSWEEVQVSGALKPIEVVMSPVLEAAVRAFFSLPVVSVSQPGPAPAPPPPDSEEWSDATVLLEALDQRQPDPEEADDDQQDQDPPVLLLQGTLELPVVIVPVAGGRLLVADCGDVRVSSAPKFRHAACRPGALVYGTLDGMRVFNVAAPMELADAVPVVGIRGICASWEATQRSHRVFVRAAGASALVDESLLALTPETPTRGSEEEEEEETMAGIWLSKEFFTSVDAVAEFWAEMQIEEQQVRQSNEWWAAAGVEPDEVDDAGEVHVVVHADELRLDAAVAALPLTAGVIGGVQAETAATAAGWRGELTLSDMVVTPTTTTTTTTTTAADVPGLADRLAGAPAELRTAAEALPAGLAAAALADAAGSARLLQWLWDEEASADERAVRAVLAAAVQRAATCSPASATLSLASDGALAAALAPARDPGGSVRDVLAPLPALLAAADACAAEFARLGGEAAGFSWTFPLWTADGRLNAGAGLRDWVYEPATTLFREAVVPVTRMAVAAAGGAWMGEVEFPEGGWQMRFRVGLAAPSPSPSVQYVRRALEFGGARWQQGRLAQSPDVADVRVTWQKASVVNVWGLLR